ncbi:MAG TPA: hypothetical protein VF017_17795 [Thermoanaerobaculia bacterium]|nr:hypothetical protein [Thermoanaerobaculia bacterium]
MEATAVRARVSETMGSALASPALRWPRAAYEQALSSALCSVRRLAVDPTGTESARHRLDQLLSLPAAERLAALTRKAPDLALFEALRRRVALTDVTSELAVELARLAEQVSARLDAALYGAAFVLDRRCESSLALVRSCRGRGEIGQAERALTSAEAFASQGTGAQLAPCLAERARLTALAGDGARAAELWRAAARLHAEAQEPQEQALALGELAGALWRGRRRRGAVLQLLAAIAALGRAGRLRQLPQLLALVRAPTGPPIPRPSSVREEGC